MSEGTATSDRNRIVVGGIVLALVVAGVLAAIVIASHRARPHVREPVAHRSAPSDPVFRSKVERGAYVFLQRGCPVCHGEGGRGGVRNPNYVLGTVPALDEIADKMGLYEKADADAFVRILESGADLDAPSPPPTIDDYPRVLAQYHAIRSVIENGAVAGKLDPNGPAPPLSMPAWKSVIPLSDVDALIAYLVSLMPWDRPD